MQTIHQAVRLRQPHKLPPTQRGPVPLVSVQKRCKQLSARAGCLVRQTVGLAVHVTCGVSLSSGVSPQTRRQGFEGPVGRELLRLPLLTKGRGR
jgi:hypothetical protein